MQRLENEILLPSPHLSEYLTDGVEELASLHTTFRIATAATSDLESRSC